MKKFIRIVVAFMWILFISCPSFAANGEYRIAGKTGPAYDNLISMDFQDANLKTVLKIFSQQSGLNFIAGQNVQDRTVTIYFDNVTVEDALSHLMDANNLVYEQELGSNIFIVKESGKPAVETITKIYELKYAQLSSSPTQGQFRSPTTQGQLSSSPTQAVKGLSGNAEIVSTLKALLSKNGKIVADKRSNSIIIEDVPSQFPIVEDVLLRLDVRTLQVMIEAEIIETTTTVADQLGVNWTGSFGTFSGPVLRTKWPFKGALLDKDLITTDGTMTMAGAGFTLSALLSNSDSKILARPKVLTLNNETAIIELTSSTAIAAVTTTTSADTSSVTGTNAERINTGITLKVTPQINNDGYITMYIEPTVIVPVLSKFFAGSGTDAKFVDPQTRSARTTVMVKDGETIVIGGLISNEDTYSFEKIPLLGDIPFLGAAFRYKTADKADKELLIFITPHIVRETNYSLSDLSEREQEKPPAVREKEIKNLLDLLGGR